MTTDAKNVMELLPSLLKNADTMVRKYGRSFPTCYDDIKGAAYLAVAESIQRFKGANKDLPKYCNICVRNAIIDHIERDSIVPRPRSQMSRSLSVELMEDEEPRVYDDDNTLYLELRHRCEQLHPDNKVILDGLEKGETPRAICAVLGVSHQTVYNRILSMRQEVKDAYRSLVSYTEWQRLLILLG